jgi:hypothetical protein
MHENRFVDVLFFTPVAVEVVMHIGSRRPGAAAGKSRARANPAVMTAAEGSILLNSVHRSESGHSVHTWSVGLKPRKPRGRIPIAPGQQLANGPEKCELRLLL